MTVYPLDKTKLQAAKAAYTDLQNKQTDDEKEAATDKTKILIIDNKTPADITEGVQFTTTKDWQPLDGAIRSVINQEHNGFESQKECDDTAKTLQAAIDEFKGTIKIGTNKATDAYILQQVNDELLNPDKGDYAYSSRMQPLKPGYAYYLFNGYYSVSNSSVDVSIEWSVSGSDKVTIGDTDEGDKDSRGNHYSYGAKIADGTTTPTEVTFTATVTRNDTQKEIGKINYTATLGAPISATLQTDVPQFTATNDATNATKFTGVVQITLNGADAIASVSNDCVTMDSESTASDAGKVSFSHISVDKVEKSETGLNVTVSVTTGGIGGVWSENSPVPASSDGKLLNISIDPSKFQLKTMEEGNSSWYLPTGKLQLSDMTVEVLTPAFTKVERTDDPTTGDPTFTIHTQNMPENAKVEVALAKTSVNAADIEKSTIKATATRGSDGKYSVTFEKSDFEANAEYYIWLRYGSSGSNWAYPENNRPTYTFGNTTSGGEGGGSITMQ